MLVALGSAKASPGATTTAVALGAVWPEGAHVLVAECDPAGGDLAAWFGLAADPGLVSLAAAARHAAGVELVAAHCQRLPGGLRVVAAPAAAAQASGALSLLPGGLLRELDHRPDVVVVADCGRLWDGSPAAAVVGRASVLLLVVRPVAAELGHLAGLVSTLQADAARLGVVLVGAGPYKPEEITATFGVPVLGALPADRRAAAVLSGGAGGWKVLRRTPLLRAARGLAGALERLRAPDAAATLDRAVGRPAMGGVSGDEVGGRR